MLDILPPKILVAERDEALSANLCNTIERYFFDVTRVKNADEALRASVVDSPHVAIISSRVQDMAARELATNLSKVVEFDKLPFIFIIDQEELENNYTLDGNDLVEILRRPYSPDDLMKTLRTLLRKSKPIFQDKVIKYQDIRMDLSTFKVYRGKKEIHLGPTEFKILQLFVTKPNKIFSRRQIIDYVWGTDKDIAPRTIDVHINRIRTLMKLESDEYQLIKTIRAAGYSLS